MDVATEPPETEREILTRCFATFRERIPPSWAFSEAAPHTPAASRPDGAISLVAPDGSGADFIVEVKRSVERRDVASIAEQLEAYTRQFGAQPLLVGRYLSPSVRDAVAERGISYIDATGNIRIDIRRPPMYISDRGLDRDPWRIRQGRPRGTLKGSPASRVVRTLIDNSRTWRVRDLVAESGASTGATYRVLEFLQMEGLVKRSEVGQYDVVDWRALLQAWVKDYGFMTSNKTVSFIDPRGIANIAKKATETEQFTWAATGSLAAEEWQSYAPVKAATIYVDNIDRAAELWGLVRTKSGANVILAEPESDIAFRQTLVSSKTGLRIAAPSQVAADLLTGPGRNPSEGVELIEWMARNERVWRA